MTVSTNPFHPIAIATCALAAGIPFQPCVTGDTDGSIIERRSVPITTLATNAQLRKEQEATTTTLTSDQFHSAISQAITTSLISQKKYLLGLPKGWDGYGASSPSEPIINELYADLVEGLVGIDCRPPDIIPGGDGTIQAEWHLSGFELSYSIAPLASKYMSVVTPNFDLEFFDEDALPAFRKWAHRLDKKAAAAPLVA